MRFFKGIVRFFANSIALLLSLLFFAILLVFASVKIMANFTSRDNLNAILTKVDIMEIKFTTEDKKETTVKNYVDELLQESNLTEEQRTKVINNPEISKILTDSVADIVDYILYGGDKVNIDSNRIIKVVEDSGYTLSSEDKKAITSSVEEINDDINKPTEDGENIDIKQYVDEFNKYTEPKKLIGYVVLLFITFYAAIAFFKWSLVKPFIYLGIPSLIMGSILAAGGKLKDTILLAVKFENENYKDLINSVIAPLLDELKIYGIVLLVVGIVFIVAYILVVILKKKYSEPTNEFDVDPADLVNKRKKTKKVIESKELTSETVNINTIEENKETTDNENDKEEQ